MQGLVLPWGWEESGAALEGCSQGRGTPRARALACGDWALQSRDSPGADGRDEGSGLCAFPVPRFSHHQAESNHEKGGGGKGRLESSVRTGEGLGVVAAPRALLGIEGVLVPLLCFHVHLAGKLSRIKPHLPKQSRVLLGGFFCAHLEEEERHWYKDSFVKKSPPRASDQGHPRGGVTSAPQWRP